MNDAAGRRRSSRRSHTGLLRAVVALLLPALAAACAAPGKSESNAPGGPASLERVATALTGRYAGRVEDRAGGQLVRLEARIERGGADGIAVEIVQRNGEAEPRSFLLTFRPTAIETRLVGRFAPRDPRGNELGSCAVEVSVQSDGFVARTDAESCRFGEAGQSSALVKEIAHDGRQLVIGDRVLDPASGESLIDDRVLQLQRVNSFRGWVGVRDAPDTAWRIAERIELDSDGSTLTPNDSADMGLGVALELAPYRVRSDLPMVLRLRAFDAESGELLGQAWADVEATHLGLALRDLQIGLSLQDDR